MKTGEQSPGQPIPRILVVDDDPAICQQLSRLLAYYGYQAVSVSTAEAALERLEAGDIDLVITDVRLPGLGGVGLTKRLREQSPDVPVIVITGYADLGTAVEVLKLGASDYIAKPFSAEAIQKCVQSVLNKAQVFIEIRHLRQTLRNHGMFVGMLSKTPEMHRVFETIRLVSGTDTTVLVEGETGTGKELVASAIHHQSSRRDGPFVTINCGGLPETLLESELFGYERGAFTGAEQARPGKIEVAHGGTLFLDEIESMSLPMQAKLLLVLQDQKVQRLGGKSRAKIDMRVIAASNVPLKELVARGQMRTDFYYRINVIPIHLIPLRQRREDIPLLVQDFLRYHPLARRKGLTGVSDRVLAKFMEYPWPGNVRELQNILERALVLTTGKLIDEVDLPDASPPDKTDASTTSVSVSLRQWLREHEKRYLLQQLKAFGGKIGLTAKFSGMDVKTLYRKLRFHGINKEDFQSNQSVLPDDEDRNDTTN